MCYRALEGSFDGPARALTTCRFTRSHAGFQPAAAPVYRRRVRSPNVPGTSEAARRLVVPIDTSERSVVASAGLRSPEGGRDHEAVVGVVRRVVGVGGGHSFSGFVGEPGCELLGLGGIESGG